jgi:hypothetical protein
MIISEQSEYLSNASSFALRTGIIFRKRRVDQLFVITDRSGSRLANIQARLIEPQHFSNRVTA